MDDAQFLEAAIKRGVKDARAQYTSEHDRLKLEGSLAGFDECRGLDAAEFLPLLERARADTEAAEDTPDYWWWRCREVEIAWIAEVISAERFARGLPRLVPVGYRATVAVSRIQADMKT